MITNKTKGIMILIVPAGVLIYGAVYVMGATAAFNLIGGSVLMTGLIGWGVHLLNKPDELSTEDLVKMLGERYHPDTPMSEVMESLHEAVPVPDYELPDFTDGNGNLVRGGDCIGKPPPDGPCRPTVDDIDYDRDYEVARQSDLTEEVMRSTQASLEGFVGDSSGTPPDPTAHLENISLGGGGESYPNGSYAECLPSYHDPDDAKEVAKEVELPVRKGGPLSGSPWRENKKPVPPSGRVLREGQKPEPEDYDSSISPAGVTKDKW